MIIQDVPFTKVLSLFNGIKVKVTFLPISQDSERGNNSGNIGT